MPTDPNSPPIEVSPDMALGPAGAVLRYTVTAIGGYVLSKGLADSETVQFVSGLVMVVVPTLYGAYRQHQNKKALITVARAAPDDVAVVTGAAPKP